MIWESIPLMTVIDVAFIALAGGGLAILIRLRRGLPTEGGLWGLLFVVVGLSLLGVFYAADLVVMHVLPATLGRPEAMTLMEDMHLRYSWIVFLASGGCVLVGVGLTARTLLSSSKTFDLWGAHLQASLEERDESVRDFKESEEKLRRIFENMQDGYLLADMAGKVLLANPAAARLLLYEPEELKTLNMERDIYADARQREELKAALDRWKQVENFEIAFKRKDGQTIIGESSVHFVMNEEGKPVAIEGLFRDITERKHREEELSRHREHLEELVRNRTQELAESEQRETLLKEVAIAAAHAGGVDEAFVAALDSVCAFTGWPVGHVYMIAPDDPERLDPTTLWHLPSEERFDVFKEVTERTPFVLGEGLPGRVLSSRSPSWIVDVNKDPNFPRAKLADDLGVKGAFGFPVLVGNELVAVLEFFSEEPQDPDETLLEMVGQVGIQLGGSILRHRSAEEIEKSRLTLRALFEALPVGVMMIGPEGQVLETNTVTEDILGISTDEQRMRDLQSREWSVVRSDGTAMPVEEYPVSRALAGERLVSGVEMGWPRPSGDLVWLSLSAARIEGLDDVGVAVAFEDITSRKEAAATLLEAKEAADTANKELAERYEQLRELAGLRDSLTHMIVHDLRSPLTGILTSLQLLEMDAEQLSEESAEDVQRGLRSAGTLMQMITALLDVCKMEAGEMTLHLKDGDLLATAEESLESLGGLVSTRNVSLEGDEGGVRAEYDPELTGRIVANLVSNALKFTPERGSVTVRVKGVNGRARVEVQDEGPGIPEEYLGKIFEKFGQVETKERGVTGTGLGLAFCKLAVEAHGGKIGVDSVVGEGSTFWFELPT